MFARLTSRVIRSLLHPRHFTLFILPTSHHPLFSSPLPPPSPLWCFPRPLFLFCMTSTAVSSPFCPLCAHTYTHTHTYLRRLFSLFSSLAYFLSFFLYCRLYRFSATFVRYTSQPGKEIYLPKRKSRAFAPDIFCPIFVTRRFRRYCIAFILISQSRGPSTFSSLSLSLRCFINLRCVFIR